MFEAKSMRALPAMGSDRPFILSNISQSNKDRRQQGPRVKKLAITDWTFVPSEAVPLLC
jgi:hypothetical protein